MGYEPTWGVAQAIDNFRWNFETYTTRRVTALLDDQSLQYLRSVQVLPVFFVPADGREPTDAERGLLERHLLLAQQRYRKMLKGRDTFTVAPGGPLVYKSSNDLVYFRNADDQGNVKYMTELLAYLSKTRYEVPYVLVIIVMNPCDDFPAGGGRPIHGGLTRGGGNTILSSFSLTKVDGGFQSTLQHELGHAFGLVHPDSYGYRKESSESNMSYNPAHVWKGFVPPTSQGILIPEDLRALAVNKLAFPNLYFDPSKDIPMGYRMGPLTHLVPLDLNNDWPGYRLFVDGKLVKQERDWTGKQAVEDFIEMKSANSRFVVEGLWETQPFVVVGKGYELFFGGVRVGHEPNWRYQQAFDNLKANKDRQPCSEVFGLYDGRMMP